MIDNEKIVDGARTFTDLTTWVTKGTGAVTKWISQLSWWEVVLIVVFVFLLVLYFYLKQLSSTKVVRRRYFR